MRKLVLNSVPNVPGVLPEDIANVHSLSEGLVNAWLKLKQDAILEVFYKATGTQLQTDKKEDCGRIKLLRYSDGSEDIEIDNVRVGRLEYDYADFRIDFYPA